MMRPADADFDLLGVSHVVEEPDLHRAYHRRCEIYGPDALATYSLLEESERRAALDQLEAAYRRILEWIRTRTHPPRTPPPPDRIEADEPEPEIETRPGAWLRFHRRRRGLSVEAVSLETKIRPGLIRALENENAAELPAAVFVRGFVIQYSQLMGADDPEQMAQTYLARLGESG
jgi:hypothetical protein